MKVIKEKSRTYKGKDYFKYRINIPEVYLLSVGFKVGDELNIEVKDGKIILSKD